ncbi:MAG: SDR family oxidoreductase [Candidatus Nanopelagicales bacterium]
MATALVTGATAGIGAAFARRLAQNGYDLVLVAREVARLEATANDLRRRFGADVEVLPADLADRAQLKRVEERLADDAPPIELLVNNAGFGLNRSFIRSDIEQQQAQFDVLVTAVLRLTHAAARGMVARGHGSILNVSSVASFLPSGTYGAAKAYVTHLSESLNGDLARQGVHVMAFCPGFVRTEMQQRMGVTSTGIPDWMWLDADVVVDKALHDLERGLAVSVQDIRYKVIVGVLKVAPRRAIAAAYRRRRNTAR